MSLESQQQIAREVNESLWIPGNVMSKERTLQFILSAIERAKVAVPDGMLSGGVQKMDAAAQRCEKASLLHEHDAEIRKEEQEHYRSLYEAHEKQHEAARKPLVDAGSKLANLLKDSYWVQCPLDVAKAADELLDALEKVKQ
jgi:hypothetical protein